ncbi:hypothetical protein 278BB001_32 [Bacillus phage 278BB001]|nr:hypothetical protein 278BB001_32 [Bacillus phage 278BB001]
MNTNRKISKLQNKAIERCFNNPSSEHMRIMKEMIEEAFHEGRQQGKKEMASITRNAFSDLLLRDI